MSVVKFKANRLDSENILYRGKVIELRSHISTGYGGRYAIGTRKRFTTLKEAKAHVDKVCLERGVDSLMNPDETLKFIAEW